MVKSANQKSRGLIDLLLRAWEFRNSRIHDPDHVSLIIQADGDAFSYRQSLKQVRPRHREHDRLS